LAVPAEAVHEYTPLVTVEAVNLNTAFWQTVAAEAVMVGVASTGDTLIVTVPEVPDWQVTSPYATCANAVANLVPVAVPLTV
jgi:hypothetical protein